MTDIPNRNNRDPASRIIKINSFTGKGNDAPDSRVSGLRNVSPTQNVSAGSPGSSNVTTNHHPISNVQHHQNHRPFYPRGRFRNDGGYYGSHNHFGGYHSGLSRRNPPLVPGPPFPKMLVDFMMKEWNDFATHFRDIHGGDHNDDWPIMLSGHQQNQQQSMAPTSPRAGSHINSPHRGQHTRYNYQSSAGGNWSGNNGGRKFSENGEHSGMGSLRRHHNHRGGGHAPSVLLQYNQSWQRGTLANRQNSPNNTLNRSAGLSMTFYISQYYKRGPRHHFQSRSVISPTPPPTVSATAATPLATEAATVPIAELNSLSLKPVNPAKLITTTPTIDKENPTELAVAAAAIPSDPQAKKLSTLKDEIVPLPTNLTLSNTKNQQQQVAMVKHEHPIRRRAATTQGSSSVSTSTLAILPLSSSLPATRTSEAALVASSSFCSLVDQVDPMLSADQFFTPEPPSSPSSVSASLPVAVSISQQSAVVSSVKVSTAESPQSFMSTSGPSPVTAVSTNGR